MASYFIGIDYGTGGAKGCLINLEGSVLAYRFKEYPIINPAPGWSEHDPDNYWVIAREIIAYCLSEAGVLPSDIGGIAISSALPCMVMVDKAGRPVHNAYNLMDRRATKEVQLVKDKIGEERIFSITGNRLDDHPALVNVLWEKNHRGDDFATVHKVLTIEGFVVSKLTGARVLSRQNATFLGVAFNLLKKEFDEGILDELGIDPAILPELKWSNEIAGHVTPEASRETGLMIGTPVSVGQADFNAGCIASGVIDVGDIQCNLGTCGNFGVVNKSKSFMFEMITMPFTIGEENTYITIPTTTTGGMSLRFLRDTISQAELQAERTVGVDAYDLLTLQAQAVPVGSEGLIMLPFLMGERTPIWDVYARGCLFGLSLNHTKGHIVRATMEGVGYAMYDSFRLIREAGMEVNLPVVMHEGGAKSRLWRKIITDIFDVPTVLTKRRTGAPFGDAVLAAVSVGALPDYSVCKEWAEYEDLMEPNEESHRIYMEYFGLFKKVYEHVKNDYRELARLRDL